MSEHKVVVCDKCGVVETKHPTFISIADWSIPGPMPFSKRSQHFCSWKCLSEYAGKRDD